MSFHILVPLIHELIGHHEQWQHQLVLVIVQAIDVQLQLLLASAGTSMVHGDADCACEGGRQTSSPKFGECEAASVANLAGVSASLGRHDGTEGLNGARGHSGSLGGSLLSSDQLFGGLIEVALGSELPVLAQMNIWD